MYNPLMMVVCWSNRVMKASAKGVMVIPGKTESTVAVKMLKGIAMNEDHVSGLCKGVNSRPIFE